MGALASFFSRGEQWTSLPGAIDSEIERLKNLKFFSIERYNLVANQLVVRGILERQREHGGYERLRISMTYPDNYPRWLPTVVDHDHVFEPSADGHQLSDYALCLTFPPRRELTVGALTLGPEVVGAALLWMVKRNIYERGGRRRWPDEAEPHGVGPAAAELAIEHARESGSVFVEEWVKYALASAMPPRLSAPCPCLSGKSVANCHFELAQLIARAINSGLRNVGSRRR
jgi:hypothetical protein